MRGNISRDREPGKFPAVPASRAAADDAVAVSVVMPCLNEAASVGQCVRSALAGITGTGLNGEVIVADNGSADGSPAAARAAGARVVHQPLRGYGNAYAAGFAAARGRYIVMGDSDGSYDFAALPDLIRPLRDGADYVLGSRFRGDIRKGAMKWSHRYLGNPVLTFILNLFFGLNVSDAHSGYRAFTREALDRLALQCEGMELASEIVVKAAQAGLAVAEVPITYDCRIGDSKLKALGDAWRHLRFLLLLSPQYLFVLPGLAALTLGLAGQLALIRVPGGPLTLAGKVALALVFLAGSQLLTLGLAGTAYARSIGIRAGSRIGAWAERALTLERGLATGSLLTAAGLVMIGWRFTLGWGPVVPGGADASLTIAGLVAAAAGGQLCFGAFFLAMLGLYGRHAAGRPAAGDEQAAPPGSAPPALVSAGARR